jgi:hypothetical protein
MERLGALLLLIALAAALARLVKAGLGMRWAAIAAAALLSFAPIAGTQVLGYVYSATGALSAASLVLLVLFIARTAGGDVLRPVIPDAGLMALVVIVLGVPFYALVLGIGAWDPYALGYQSLEVVFVLAALALVGGWMRAPVMSLWLICAMLLFLSDSYASRNILDYLIDPLAVLLSAVLLLKRWMLARRQAAPSLLRLPFEGC